MVGVSGGIDSAVVSTLCAETGLRTYVLSMPLLSNQKNDTLSNDYVDYLSKKYVNVEKVRVDLSNTYMSLMQSIEAWTNGPSLIVDSQMQTPSPVSVW